MIMRDDGDAPETAEDIDSDTAHKVVRGAFAARREQLARRENKRERKQMELMRLHEWLRTIPDFAQSGLQVARAFSGRHFKFSLPGDERPLTWTAATNNLILEGEGVEKQRAKNAEAALKITTSLVVDKVDPAPPSNED